METEVYYMIYSVLVSYDIVNYQKYYLDNFTVDNLTCFLRIHV